MSRRSRLVGRAIQVYGADLATRDARPKMTYEAVGVRVLVAG